ncbi:GNAT family N-acetyltransferase [Microbacterium sp. 1.5R]|uniref:GNAT family N-acetyltransferase n=1 Tax=Microbacterium sp. 1.5R TaxID=1916917 RepID=UPI00119D7370|nr:GNAT family N-acetyltransferase [Microbacterium sp. 1.5R]
MTTIDARDVPADSTSAERLGATGLDYRVVDVKDPASAEAFQRAVSRGFLGAEPTAESLEFGRATFESRRNTGVYDSAVPDGRPVATIDSWITPLTLPGGDELPMWAISGVTVSATHRRRGIARALLEGELRAAASAGVPIAGLTVSEATIYGRYGFGSAIPVMGFQVDARRAGWAAPAAPGRLEYIDRDALAAELGTVHERARTARPGQVPGWSARWGGMAGLSPSDTDRDRARGVRYRDEAGRVTGVIAYTLAEHGTGAAWRHTLKVRLLVAETADATAALWRFALQHDLVDGVEAELRPIDDPLPWLVHDQRGVTQTLHDHGWLRVLDVPTSLSARRYSAPLDVVLRVQDPLGFADGDWRLRVDSDGTAQVEPTTADAVDVELDVSALSSLYVGGVRAAALHGAGRIAADADAVAALDRAFTSTPAPSLDIWY